MLYVYTIYDRVASVLILKTQEEFKVCWRAGGLGPVGSNQNPTLELILIIKIYPCVPETNHKYFIEIHSNNHIIHGRYISI